jgi:hypothetical protein
MAVITTLFHSFAMGDVEDPEIYAADPLWKWQQTEQGAWAMSHAQDLRCDISMDERTFGYHVRVLGRLVEQDYTYYQLRWAK